MNTPTDNPPPLEISAEDVEEGPIRMDYTSTGVDDIELLHYIEKFVLNEGFYDYYDQLLPTIFEHPNMKTNILWVENPTTGTFQPVNKKTATESMIAKTGTSASDSIEGEDQQLENLPLLPKINLAIEKVENTDEDLLVPPNPRAQAVSSNNQNSPASPEDQWTIIRMEYHHFNFMKRLLFLFFQGVLAGFCFITFYIQISSNGNLTQFLDNYQPVAQEIRRFFYLISTISMIGSIDYVKTVWNANTPSNPFTEHLSKDIARKLEDYQKTTLFVGIVVLILHFITFVVSIVISFYDVQISLQFNYQNNNKAYPTWTSFALNDSKFSDSIHQWITADRIRIATGLLAWIGCCILLWRDVSRYRKMWLNLRRLRSTAMAWMHRAKLLEGGSELDNLSGPELQELVNVLEIGLQRAKTSLNVIEREQIKT